MQDVKNIAILMACFNRKPKTIECINKISNLKLCGYCVKIYLVDDASTDGTKEAVQKSYPDVVVIEGVGNLFWAGGMRKAFEEASKNNYAGYLMLNDDTFLYSCALESILTTVDYSKTFFNSEPIVVGSVKDPATGAISYGGRISRGGLQPLFYDFVQPRAEPLTCDTANANCLYIPSSIFKVVGGLDPIFKHGKADYDYCLRAKKMGFKILVAPEFIGECSSSFYEHREDISNLNLYQRWKYITSPKRYPVKEWMTYTYRHTGLLWPLHFLRPYLKLIF
jgi:GT2 family glycosyltransferase